LVKHRDNFTFTAAAVRLRYTVQRIALPKTYISQHKMTVRKLHGARIVLIPQAVRLPCLCYRC